MPRLPRINIEGCLYYITSVGNHGENIFRDEGDYKMYLELLKKYKEQYNFKLFSFALMPNQLNLLLELKGATTISMIMHDTTTAYTKYFNGRYQRKGHLFQERFKSVVVEKGPYLTQLISYTHLSPVWNGLAKNPAEYIYSSHNLYLYNAASKTERAENIRKILDLGQEIEEVSCAIAKDYPDKITYADFTASITHQEIESLRKKLQRAGILGSEQFVEKIKSQLANKTAPVEEEKNPLKPVVSIAIVVLLAGVGLGVFYIQRIQKDAAQRQKKINEAKQEAVVKKEQIVINPLTERKPLEQMPLAELNGTEWTIEVKAVDKNVPLSIYFDKLQFKGGKVSSKSMLDKGFLASNYTLTVQEDGTLSWETMQKNSLGETIFWRGETTKDNKMSGVFSKQASGGKTEDLFFTSAGFWRKE